MSYLGSVAIDAEEMFLVNGIANRLGINYSDLLRLIEFESGFKPDAKNPYSSARGLIQFTDATARSLGFSDSLDLVTKYPTVASQLPIVEKYLKQFAPFTDKQSLYLAVFYPEYRRLPLDTRFPDCVRAVNPGIDTVQDYIDLVDRKKKIA
jgi:hypothetical protein